MNQGYSSTPWAVTQASDSISWASETFAQNQNANAVRFGTLYNFRFDSDQAPHTTTATVGFFKTGSPMPVVIEAPVLADATPTPTPTASPSITPTPTPTPTPTATPTGCDSGLIQNEGFETGSFSPWVIDGTLDTPLVTNTLAHTGTFSAIALSVTSQPYCGSGAEALGDSSFYQQFGPVPAGATLSFWYNTCTTDSITFDWQDAYITDSNGNILQTIFHQCTNNNAWVNQTVDMSAYAGQTVRIKFLVHGDAFGDLTAMYVDDVSLPGQCASPSPTPTTTGTPSASPTGTPTLAQLEQYNIVVPFSNNPYSDPVGMGNVLADYADAGGIVVGLNFDWFGPPFGLDGRWMTGGYTPFNYPGPTNFTTSCLGTYDTSHPLMQGISAGSLCAFFRHTLTLAPGAVSVAMYQDSQQLVAYKVNNGHTGVGINAYLGENPMNFSGLFGRVIVNAGRWLISGPCGTPSPTPTATATATATFTPTATATATATFTPTATATATATATVTATATATSTPTPAEV